MMNNSQPTYKRQRFLLSFIRQLSSSVSSTELQKLVFLHIMENNIGYYEFIPYRFGAYSFQLAEDVDILRKDGFLSDEGKHIEATGEYTLDGLFDITIERGNNLIRKAYREYPFYTIKSDIIDGLFYNRTEAELFYSERLKYVQAEETLFTIGYEGKSIEAFIDTLILNDIKLLCDVRKNPFSRKFGFSKGKLEHITETVGIRYVHIPELGIESYKRNSLETDEEYQTLFDYYAETLPNLRMHLERIYSLLRSNTRIALMCYEKDALMCHRHIIKDYIQNTHGVDSEDL